VKGYFCLLRSITKKFGEEEAEVARWVGKRALERTEPAPTRVGRILRHSQLRNALLFVVNCGSPFLDSPPAPEMLKTGAALEVDGLEAEDALDGPFEDVEAMEAARSGFDEEAGGEPCCMGVRGGCGRRVGGGGASAGSGD